MLEQIIETNPSLVKPSAEKPIPTSGFPVANQISAAIAALPERDNVPADIPVRDIVTSLAEENGFFNIWTPEERAVAAALRRLGCGPRSAHYGWRLYSRYRHSGDIGTDAIKY